MPPRGTTDPLYLNELNFFSPQNMADFDCIVQLIKPKRVVADP